MKQWIFIALLLLESAASSSQDILYLPQLVLGAEEILFAKYNDVIGDSLIFLAKDFHSSKSYNDTIILLQSQAFPSSGMNKAKEEDIRQRITKWIQESHELLLFTHHREGKVIVPFHSGIRIYNGIDVRFVAGNTPSKVSGFLEFPEKITWEELQQRIRNIEARFQNVYDLNKIRNPSKRNKALFQWLDAHMNEFHMECDFNADCGWGGIQDGVLRWILASHIVEDAWKVSEVYRQIYAPDKQRFEWFTGTTMDPGESFKSPGGLDFLLDKAFDQTQSNLDRENALVFLISALDFVMLDTFQDHSCFRKQSQSEKQQELLDRLMSLMHNENLAFMAFINILRLSHSEYEPDSSRINLSRLPELMEIYKSLPPDQSRLRSRMTDFLLANCTPEQWKSLTGNDALIHVIIYQSSYNRAKQQLRFSTAYQPDEGLIHEKPKVRFEKWKDGRIEEVVTREFYYEKDMPFTTRSTYLQQKVDVADLSPGTWTFYLFGTAGQHSEYRWESDKATFEK